MGKHLKGFIDCWSRAFPTDQKRMTTSHHDEQVLNSSSQHAPLLLLFLFPTRLSLIFLRSRDCHFITTQKYNMASSQQDGWEGNIYVLTTTRITIVFGLTYLVRSCYQLYRMMRAPDDGTAVANRGRSCWSCFDHAGDPLLIESSDRNRRREHWSRAWPQWLLLRKRCGF